MSHVVAVSTKFTICRIGSKLLLRIVHVFARVGVNRIVGSVKAILGSTVVSVLCVVDQVGVDLLGLAICATHTLDGGCINCLIGLVVLEVLFGVSIEVEECCRVLFSWMVSVAEEVQDVAHLSFEVIDLFFSVAVGVGIGNSSC